MTDSYLLLALVLLAGIGTLGVLLISVQLWAASRNQRIAQHQAHNESATAHLFEFLDLDAEVQSKLWDCYSTLLDSYFTPSVSVPNEELKQQTEERLKAIETLTLRRAQALTKCATLLPANTYLAAQDLFKSRGRMLTALWDTKYEDMHHSLYVTLLQYQYGFKARNTLVSAMRRLLGVDLLTVELPEQWERRDGRTPAIITEKLKETVLRRLDEKNVLPKGEVSGHDAKDSQPITLGETPIYFGNGKNEVA